VGIKNPRNLAWGRKEVLMDKGIVIRQENAESRMRVVPAYDSVIGEFFVLHFVDVFPCVLSEGHVGSGFFGIQPCDGSLHFNHTLPVLSYQHPADFGLTARASVLPDLPHDLAVDEQGWLSACRF
jgi:hypothetical protein